MFLNDAKYYEQVLLQILRGEKPSPKDYPGHIAGRLMATFEKQYQNGGLIYEPQTLMQLRRNGAHNPKYLGLSKSHPISTVQMREAEQLKAICIAKGKPVIAVEMFGLSAHKRDSWKSQADYSHDPDKGGMLTSGDIVPLWQLMSVLRQREVTPSLKAAPIIIQNAGHIWEDLFRTDAGDWPQRRRKMEKLNVHVTSGPAETADLMAELSYGQKIEPEDLNFSVATHAEFTGRRTIFPTGDTIKMRHTVAAHRSLTPRGSVRFSSDVFGPSGSTDEQTYSYSGNAAEKAQAFKDYLTSLGIEKALALLAWHDYGDDIDDVMVVKNDGGLGLCLENASGQRRYDIFTPELFPDTYHKLNPLQSGPGVELAYMKRTAGLRSIMDNVERRVAEILAEDKRFTRDDLTAYDTSMYMAVPLLNLLEAIQLGQDISYEDMGGVSAFSVQKLKVASAPYCGPDADPETEDYFIAPGQTLPRSHDPKWFENGPNAEAYRFLHAVVGSDFSSDRLDKKYDLYAKTRMGLLATPDLLRRSGPSDEFRRVRNMLPASIVTQQGPDVWRRYHRDPHNLERIFTQAAHGPSIQAYDENLVRLLDDAGVMYIGKTPVHMSWKERFERNRVICRSGVRNQTYNWIPTILDEEGGADVLTVLRHKKAAGFVQQKIEDIFTLSRGIEDAVEKITVAAQNRKKITPVERKFSSNGVAEKHDCMVITTYFSATNCAKSLQEQANRLGYLIAINGFSLKFGGGNDGLMKAVALGFLKGKVELREKGYDFPNQLISVQCVDTEAIEKRFEVPEETHPEDFVHRCHSAIEPREADLQNIGLFVPAAGSVVGGGGLGTDEEVFAELDSRMSGLIHPATHPLIMFDQQLQTSKGVIGVNDPYKKLIPQGVQDHLNMIWAMTGEEIVARMNTLRASQPAISVLEASDLENTLRNLSSLPDNASLSEKMKLAARASLLNSFRPPYDLYTGPEGGLPPASLPNLPEPEIRFG